MSRRRRKITWPTEPRAQSGAAGTASSVSFSSRALDASARASSGESCGARSAITPALPSTNGAPTALASPHLLALSGIGDGAQLQRLGIPVAAHLPGVGRNLQDHWNAPFALRVTPDSSLNHRLRGWRKYLEGARYLATRGGFLAMGSSAVSAYVRSTPDRPQPDLQLAIRPMTSQFLPGGKVEIDPLPGISGACVLVHPDSRGELRTASPDPMADPEFHPNYLDDPGDVRRLISGIRLMRKVLGAAPIATRIEAELAPGTGLETDEALEGYIRGSGGTSWHPVGTCKMGRDPMAVVDPRLRVHGIAGLRVADASVMPRIIGGNTHAPTVMIAEKAADLVRGETGRA